MTQPTSGSPTAGVPTCYRHAGRETWIRCQRCERPICPDCMRDAAVGFQCPSCVAEAARTTRSIQAPYGGARSSNPALTSMVLVGINVAVWLAILVTGGSGSALVDRLGLRANGACAPGDGYLYDMTRTTCDAVGGRFLTGVADGAWWQLVSSQFAHVEIWHIAGNMLALYVLGPQLEAVLGRARFLALYLVSGLAGSVTVLWLSPEIGLTLGASGAIYGLFGALGVVAHKVGGDLRSLGGLLVLNLVITFAVPGISWQGHLGGLVGGALIAVLLVYAPRQRRGLVQWSGLAAMTVALVALAAGRILALA
ncbi:rhomboid family intramembrane serine protease [Nocardioides sp. Soil805]|uniref:rhomboid family intramembrane serine protease n=1 Tax=Nocardioides sp. Soil805 TaxID=1736416 RepID=UPI00070371EA|nr:rhomboid family intramembrane serine protease [Nocardioides sp. Soil805]KRF37564.1 rhomboid family protein [Nocardioides sp. Soil805]